MVACLIIEKPSTATRVSVCTWAYARWAAKRCVLSRATDICSWGSTGRDDLRYRAALAVRYVDLIMIPTFERRPTLLEIGGNTPRFPVIQRADQPARIHAKIMADIRRLRSIRGPIKWQESRLAADAQ